MYLKIQIKGKKPSFYKVDKSEFLVGTIASCDIVLVDSHVSKKHLKFISDDHSTYILDNGSTNGTFVDEERLIPGKKVRLDSHFLIQLGANVFISDASESSSKNWVEVKSNATQLQDPKSPNSEKTTVLSIEDFKAADALARKLKAEKLAEKRKQNQLKKKKDNSLMLKTMILTVIIIALGVYLNKNYKFNEKKKDTNITKAAKALAKQQEKLDKIE